MRQIPVKYAHRLAFTIVELMVVILIIAVLVSLISSAAMLALAKIPVVQTSTDIAQLSLAMQHFMRDYNLIDPPPSYLVLRENLNSYNLLNPRESNSINFLRTAFGKNLGRRPDAWNGWVDWNGNGLPDLLPFYLEGEQCLVFYLGGIPSVPTLYPPPPVLPPVYSPQGFSINNMNPAYFNTGNPAFPLAYYPLQPIGGGRRYGPYFQFQTPRLVPLGAVNPATVLPTYLPFPLSLCHPVYIDGYQTKTTFNPSLLAAHPAPYANGIPYAFFSSQGNNNVYNPLDCPGIGAVPYFITGTVPPQFMNSNQYQIISAGKDGTFGITGWFPTGGTLPPGADDQANFSTSLLGAGQ